MTRQSGGDIASDHDSDDSICFRRTRAPAATAKKAKRKKPYQPVARRRGAENYSQEKARKLAKQQGAKSGNKSQYLATAKDHDNEEDESIEGRGVNSGSDDEEEGHGDPATGKNVFITNASTAGGSKDKRRMNQSKGCVSVSDLSEGSAERARKMELLQRENETLRKYIGGGVMPEMIDKLTLSNVTFYVKSTLFHKVKFITGHEMLDDFISETSVGYHCMNKLKIEESRKPAFWLGVKNHVHKVLNQQRNGIINLIKVAFVSKYI